MIDTIDKKITYAPHRLYSFTINADDSHQYFAHSQRLDKCRTYYFEKLMEGLNPYADYVAYFELSEPIGNITSEGPRAHIHGTFILRSNKLTRQFLLYGIYALRKQCHLNIDTITHVCTWAEYLLKQQEIIHMKPFTNNDHMIIRQGDSDDEEGNDFRKDAIEKKKTLKPSKALCHASQAKGLELSQKRKKSAATAARYNESPDLFLLE